MQGLIIGIIGTLGILSLTAIAFLINRLVYELNDIKTAAQSFDNKPAEEGYDPVTAEVQNRNSAEYRKQLKLHYTLNFIVNVESDKEIIDGKRLFTELRDRDMSGEKKKRTRNKEQVTLTLFEDMVEQRHLNKNKPPYNELNMESPAKTELAKLQKLFPEEFLAFMEETNSS